MRDTNNIKYPAGTVTNSMVTPDPKVRSINHSQLNVGHEISSSRSTIRDRFSQKTKSSTMIKNTSDAIAFVNEQAKVLHNLIKQFQLYVGYREQLGTTESKITNRDSWGVYLMYVQSIHKTMHQSFMGKPLFGYGIAHAIRIHLESPSHTGPLDLSDPCLISMIGLRSFLSGVSDHRLPSVKHGNNCIGELLNALTEVYICRDNLTKISREINSRKLLNASTRFTSENSSESQWIALLKNKIASVFSPTKPSSVYALP